MKEEGYNIKNPALPHFMTFTVVDWIDVFSRQQYRDILLESFNFCRKEKGMLLHGFVIMSNHVHVLMASKKQQLSELVRDYKKFTAKTILQKIQSEQESRKDWMMKRFEWAAKSHGRNDIFQFWRYGNHPEEVFTEKFMWSKLDYIHLNPVRAGIVEKASEYLYSSAKNYTGQKGLIEIDLLEPKFFDAQKEYYYGWNL